MRLTTYLRRVDELRALFSLPDAFALARPGSSDATPREVHLRPLGRSVSIRENSSDLSCLDQVFRQHEYASPYAFDPKLIIDAGANIGAASLYFSIRYPKARIVAIEPDESNFELLVKNCSAFPNVIPIKAALWFETAQLSFAEPEAEKWALSVRPEPAAAKDLIEAITVQDILRAQGAERVDFLKLDIEGAELELFSNSPGAWLDAVDYMAIELHDRFKPGCSAAFYGALSGRPFDQEIRGENVFIRLDRDRAA